MLLTELIESVRKDVECLFGILKQRFRILRFPFEYHDPVDITNVVKTCAILHNMMLLYDGLDLRLWEENIDWEKLDPDGGDDGEEFVDYVVTDEERLPHNVTHPGAPCRQIKFICSKQGLDLLHDTLRNHYIYCRRSDILLWPRRK